jgi:hypothetical protein
MCIRKVSGSELEAELRAQKTECSTGFLAEHRESSVAMRAGGHYFMCIDQI